MMNILEEIKALREEIQRLEKQLVEAYNDGYSDGYDNAMDEVNSQE